MLPGVAVSDLLQLLGPDLLKELLHSGSLVQLHTCIWSYGLRQV